MVYDYRNQAKPLFYRPVKKYLETSDAGKRIVLISPHIEINSFIHKKILRAMPEHFFSALSQADIPKDADAAAQLKYAESIEADARKPFLIIDFQKVIDRVLKGGDLQRKKEVVDFVGYKLWADANKDVLYCALRTAVYADYLQPAHKYDEYGNFISSSVKPEVLPSSILEGDLEKMIAGDIDNLQLFASKQ